MCVCMNGFMYLCVCVRACVRVCVRGVYYGCHKRTTLNIMVAAFIQLGFSFSIYSADGVSDQISSHESDHDSECFSYDFIPQVMHALDGMHKKA